MANMVARSGLIRQFLLVKVDVEGKSRIFRTIRIFDTVYPQLTPIVKVGADCCARRFLVASIGGERASRREGEIHERSEFHGVHSQGTTDADTALVGCSIGWMHGMGERWYGRRSATGDAVEWEPRSGGAGCAAESIPIVWTGSAILRRNAPCGVSSECQCLAECFTIRGASGGFHILRGWLLVQSPVAGKSQVLFLCRSVNWPYPKYKFGVDRGTERE